MRYSVLFIVVVGLFSCAPSAEQRASALLQKAQSAYQTGEYSAAKLWIDSIKILYPNAIDARRSGLALMQEVELAEQTRTIAYLDSVFARKEADFLALKNQFVKEKDEAYQDVGNFFYPTQTVEKNLHRTFLRFQVSEQGSLRMTSVYCGRSNINHTIVRVSVADGSFAETPASVDVYHTTDLGERFEKADFAYGQDGGVLDFIYLNKDKSIPVELRGGRSFRYTLSSADRQALAALFPLAEVLSAMEKIKQERSEAQLKLDFVRRKMSEKQSLDSIG
ncbi:MAG: hypothetical protein LBM61_03250 [Prevotellaceae bacterium]|jgi:hypothetical protein|nr:hypothetical protein [Prevotellaceae bacterium]